MSAHLDGNALAGALSEIFVADMTSAMVRCSSCGDVSPLALAMVFVKPKTYIARCHVCDAVLMTMQSSSRGDRLDLAGVASLQLPVA